MGGGRRCRGRRGRGGMTRRVGRRGRGGGDADGGGVDCMGGLGFGLAFEGDRIAFGVCLAYMGAACGMREWVYGELSWVGRRNRFLNFARSQWLLGCFSFVGL